jgi:hypothetical protein
MTPDDTPPSGLPRLAWPAPRNPVAGNGSRHDAAPRARDDTTRYLCAAAHLDADYADSAIREFLIEDTRPVPASPGVDAAAVLGEAVAARTRRKLRDLGLILAMVGFVFLAPAALLWGWVVLACVVGVPAALSAMKNAPKVKPVAYTLAALVGVVLLLALVSPAVAEMFEDLFGGSSASSYNSYGVSEPSWDGTVIGAVAVAAVMLAVLVADRFVVWRHLNTRFWPNRLVRVGPWFENRSVFQFSSDRQLTQLRRYVNPRPTLAAASAGEPVPLVVYRDFVPFVGAGVPEDPWSIAVPLEELPDAESRGELTTESLYAGIAEAITSLRAASALAPGRRLTELFLGEVVIVAAEELIDHIADPSSGDFLAAPGVAPFTMVRRERAEEIQANPLEWARYYQRYQVETWDRDLVVTVFVHVAVGQGALYVEWTPCVLRPIRRQYRKIDSMPRSPVRPAWRALLDLLTLPVSLPGRLVSMLSFLRPVKQDRGLVVPDVYGSASSLRELAADREVHNYFQLADVDRYLKMMESRLVLAVSGMMREAGFSPASFNERAAAVVNNNVQIDGSVTGNVVVGSDNKVENTTAQR